MTIQILSKNFGSIGLTPRVWLFVSVLMVFPFISTTLGSSMRLGGVEVWKYFWLVWLVFLLSYVIGSKCFWKQWGGRTESGFWVFIIFMICFSPSSDLVIDPWKNWFFSILAVVLFRLIMLAKPHELDAMVKGVFLVWWMFVLAFIAYVYSLDQYAGSIQHQFFLSGLLGLAAGLLLIGKGMKLEAVRGLYWLFFITAFANVVINLNVTLCRSIIPFSLVLLLISLLYLAPPLKVPFGLPPRIAFFLAVFLSLIPVWHLNGGMGNLLNELTYPIFGKIRSNISPTGREAAFQLWRDFLYQHVHFLGPVQVPLPTIKMQEETTVGPLFGLSKEEFEAIREKGRHAQLATLERQRNLKEELSTLTERGQPRKAGWLPPMGEPPVSEPQIMLKKKEGLSALTERGRPRKAGRLPSMGEPPVSEPSLALTSSHNLWLDAAVRCGLLYAMAIAWAFGYVVWLISTRFSRGLSAPLVFAYWSLAVAWGVASQFDDEHWLYHIPYLTLFFIPVLIAASRFCEQNTALKN